MKESYWGVLVFSIGMIAITFTFLFQNITNTDEHNFTILKDVTEAAMYDAFDVATYRYDGTIRIDREKYVENFIRRFAEDASLSRTYVVEIMDVNELPPKVSIRISSREKGSVFSIGNDPSIMDFDIVNKLDAILEVPY